MEPAQLHTKVWGQWRACVKSCSNGMQEVIYMANVKIYVYIYTRVYDELTK